MIGRISNAFRSVVSYIDQMLFLIALMVTTPFVYVVQHAIMLLQHIGLMKKPSTDDNAEDKKHPIGTFLNRMKPPPIQPQHEDGQRISLIKGLGFP